MPSIVTGAKLDYHVQAFVENTTAHLPPNGGGVVLGTAWLLADNIIVHLLHAHFPLLFHGMHVAAVDTLHLFPETHATARAIQARYGKQAAIYLPDGISTREEFVTKHGDCEKMNHADFDMYSKVEPFQRALNELGKQVMITGRRMDQGSQRVHMDIWEAEKRTYNPLSHWSWDDCTAFVDAHDVPYNVRHNWVIRSKQAVPVTERHREDHTWTVVDMGVPYWQKSSDDLRGGFAHAYVWKSFGDLHTSAPVEPHESERAGRFTRVAQTECGIHTRVNVRGAAHGGRLVDLMVPVEEHEALVASCDAAVVLNERQLCDVELLMNGGFSPLRGFMGNDEYSHVVAHMRLPEQQLFALPVVLDTFDESIQIGHRLVLKDQAGKNIAILDVEDAYRPDKAIEAAKIYGTTSLEHPGVYELATERGPIYLGGSIQGLELPTHKMHCATPTAVRAMLPKEGPVIAFQCRNPIHRAHYELLLHAARSVAGSTVLVHPTCGPTQPGDIDGDVRFETYQALQAERPDDFKWAYLPYSMHMAGPREAIHHMIIRKNYGATHFVIGRDMAGTKSTITGEDFYGAYDAQEMGMKHAHELGVEVVPSLNLVYTKEKGYVTEEEANEATLKAVKLSGTEFRRKLRAGEDIPEWFAFKSVVEVLRKSVQSEPSS